MSLFNACLLSGVVETRCESDMAVSVSDQDVALQGWHIVTEKPHLRTQVVMPPVDWPMSLNKLLDPKYKFPSPTVPTFFNSMYWKDLNPIDPMSIMSMCECASIASTKTT